MHSEGLASLVGMFLRVERCSISFVELEIQYEEWLLIFDLAIILLRLAGFCLTPSKNAIAPNKYEIYLI
jgi:hypothetical protein